MRIPSKPQKRWYLIAITVISILAIAALFLCNHRRIAVEGKVVVCIPVYGQSLALGEEATRITDISHLAKNNQERIVTENLDDQFGYFDNNSFKQSLKKILHYQKRSFELSIYGMAESLVAQLGPDTIICTFPGGQGATALANLSKGTPPYERFLSDLKKSQLRAKKSGADFFVGGLCFMQGESDIADYPDTDYRQLLLKFRDDINHDIKAITHQQTDIPIICYQANALTRAPKFNQYNYSCPETKVPQTFVDLLREDTSFWASGPTYPYSVVREAVHIDGVGQKCIGHLAALSAIRILRRQPRILGLLPQSVQLSDSNVVVIRFNVPCPPLVLDTIQVRKADHYGFQVITPDNKDIAESILVDSLSVAIKCAASPVGCRVRYAVNGDYMKSGNLHGPRGNLRDSQGEKLQVNIQGNAYPLHNWAYQFDEYIDKESK